MKKDIDIANATLFKELTRKALEEEDGITFIGYLMEREKIAHCFAGSPGRLGSDLVKEFLENELRVIERLEEERIKLFIEIDLYSQKQRAIRSYSPKFPLPPTPSFFDKKS